MPARMAEDRSASGNNREPAERLSRIPNRRSPACSRRSGRPSNFRFVCRGFSEAAIGSAAPCFLA